MPQGLGAINVTTNGVGMSRARRNIPSELMQLEESLYSIFFKPVTRRVYDKPEGNRVKCVAHFCVGPSVHLDLDVSDQRYAMSCDVSVTSQRRALADEVFAKLGYKHDTKVLAY